MMPRRKQGWLLVLVAACLLWSGCATTTDVPATLPDLTGAFHAISVRNLDAAIEWYSRHLGFTLESRAENDERKGALLTRAGTVLELAEFVDAIERDPRRESHEVYGIFKLGFTTAALEHTYRHLERSGVEVFFPIVETANGRRTFAVKDLDGNIIQFFGQ